MKDHIIAYLEHHILKTALEELEAKLKDKWHDDYEELKGLMHEMISGIYRDLAGAFNLKSLREMDTETMQGVNAKIFTILNDVLPKYSPFIIVLFAVKRERLLWDLLSTKLVPGYGDIENTRASLLIHVATDAEIKSVVSGNTPIAEFSYFIDDDSVKL